MKDYTAVKAILTKTEKMKKDGTAVQKRWNGRIIDTTQNIKGMICGLQDATDYYVYWIDAHILAHCHTTISQAGKRALRGNYCGDYSYKDIPEELHQQFLKAIQEEKEETADLSVLDKNQLPGFLHCVVINRGIRDYEIEGERYINPKYVKEIVPIPQIEDGYNMTYGNGFIDVIIPAHQFQN